VKNIILLFGHKNSYYLDYFYQVITGHKNIQKISLQSYDKIDKLFLAQKTRPDYLKKPIFYCEKIEYDYQLSFKPFLNHFIFFFIIDKPKNVIKKENEIDYYQLRLRRIYELAYKAKNKKIFFENEVFSEGVYQCCKDYLKLRHEFKLKKQNIVEKNAFSDPSSEDFYDKYQSKLKNIQKNNI
jgi:hypothetical protein